MAEAKAQQPDRQQREAWGDSGPSVGERLFYLDTRLNGQQESQGQAQNAWRPAVVLEKRVDGEGQAEIKVRFKDLSPDHGGGGDSDRMSVCRENQRFATGPGARLAGSGGGGAVPALRDAHGEKLPSSPRFFPSRVRFEKSSPDHDGDDNGGWISWRRENQRFAAGQGARSAGNGRSGGTVPALGAANEESVGGSTRGSWKKRSFMGAVKGFIRSQQDTMAGICSAPTDLTPSVGNVRVPTPSSASNAGTDSSVGSTGGRVASVRSWATSEGVEDALFREEKGAGVSPTFSTASPSRQPRFKGMVQNFIHAQHHAVGEVSSSRRRAPTSSVGTPTSSTGDHSLGPAWTDEYLEQGGGEELKEEEVDKVGDRDGDEVEDENDKLVKAKGICGLDGPAAIAHLGRKLERVVRELTPHVIEEIEEGDDGAAAGGGFALTVFRKNKQDEFPVPIKVGVFDTELEANRAAECFSSPVWHEPNGNSRCAECDLPFSSVRGRRRHHCRNCGRLVCTYCAGVFWPPSMLPYTYRMDSTQKKVRICRTCFAAGHEFRSALLEGSEERAIDAYSTGCVNLRVPYTIYHNELPVHCAAAGGNVSLLSWLLEDRFCNIFHDRGKTVALRDRRRRSVLGAAVDSGQLETMRYLAFTQPSTVDNVNELRTLWRGLDACLRYDEDEDAGVSKVSSAEKRKAQEVPERARGNCYHTYEISLYKDKFGTDADIEGVRRPLFRLGRGGFSMKEAYTPYNLPDEKRGVGVGTTFGTVKNACIICFSRKVDCTFVPCGHHCCCLDCAKKTDLCPVCTKQIQQRVRAIDV